MLTTIETLKPELRKSERKVADFVLARPHMVINLSIALLAIKADVSEPTIVRFCRAVGCKGFQDFKLKLAQSLASGIRYFHQDVLPGEPPDDLTVQVFDQVIIHLMEVRNRLNSEALQKAIATLARAKRIDFYSSASCGFINTDIPYRFIRLGIPTIVYTDPHLHSMAAAFLQPDTAVVALCPTDQTSDLIPSLELALEAGAQVIGIMKNGCPLADHCHISLFMSAGEKFKIPGSSIIPVVQQVIIDVLAAGVALQRSPEFLEQVRRIERSIDEKRIYSGKRL